MQAIEIFSMASSTVAVLGFCYLLYTNGRGQVRKDEQLKTELKAEIGRIKDQLEDPKTGLGAIKETVTDQKILCAQVSTRITGQVERNAQDLKELRKKKRG
jgi:hypothetical protein